jgi:hypothetical protein
MGTKKVMKLINKYTGEMECKICGQAHFANIKPQSGGSWQCVHGCKFPDDENIQNGSTIKTSFIKLTVGWANKKDDFICSKLDREWIITTDNKLLSLGEYDNPEGVKVKHRFSVFGLTPHHTTDWLRFFCNEHHPGIDFDKEFETDKPGVFARYQEKFGHDYEEYAAEEPYKRLRKELLLKGYDLPWEES